MIRPVKPEDVEEYFRMRQTLWPDCTREMHELEMADQTGKPDFAVYVLERPNGQLGGFVELSIRDRVDGSLEARVPYIEGWFVDEDLRGSGAGRQLVERAEKWARDQRFKEIASDAEIENEGSIAAHAKLGFKETFRLVHFLKRLS